MSAPFAAVPPLQGIACKSIAANISEMPPAERTEFVAHISEGMYPNMLRECVVTKFAQCGSLVPDDFMKLSAGGLEVLDLSDSDSEAFDTNMFDLVWVAERGISSIRINNTTLTPCLYRMLIYAHVIRPAGISLLIELSISYCEELSDQIIDAVCSTFPNLKILTIPYCIFLSGDALLYICNSTFATTLEELDYSYNVATAIGLERVSKLSTLRKLSIAQLKDVEKFEPPQLYALQYLDASGMSSQSSENMRRMFEPTVLRLLELRIGESCILTEDLVAITSTLCDPLPLKLIDMSWCEELTADSISDFAAACPNLETLALQSTKMNSPGIQNVARHCHELKALNLSRCVDIDNDALLCLSLNCCRLNSLDISWSPVGSEGLLTFLDRTTKLSVLCLQGCKTIDQLVLDRFLGTDKSARPLQLSFLDLSWVNICSEQHARSISLAWPGLFVVGNSIHFFYAPFKYSPNILLSFFFCHRLLLTGVSERRDGYR